MRAGTPAFSPPRRREIVKKSLRLAARACHLLSICYDGSAAAAGPPPRMAARRTRRGMSAREREAIPPEVKRRVMAGDARGSGSPSPHGGCATPRAGRPRGREATVQMHGQRDRVRDARGSGAHRRTADAPRPERDARGSGSPRRRAGRTGRVRGDARASCGEPRRGMAAGRES